MKKINQKKVSEFLTVRNIRFKPSEAEDLRLKRIDKIDFSGNIYLSNKPTNTDMILARKGDLVISGINASKGALAIYHGEEDVLATIHYSSYQFDEKKINIDYLQNFVKSPVFQHTLRQQVKGGMKTELKPKHILNLEIPHSNLTEQEAIVLKIRSFMATHSQAKAKIEALQTDLKAYRKSILQEAIKGNLTATWRAKNSTEKIDLKILKKETTKKQKPLPPIKSGKVPFVLPQNWSWVRFGDVCELSRGRFSARPRNDPQYFEGEYPFIQIGSLNEYGSVVNKYSQSLNEKGLKVSKLFSKGTIMIAIVGGTIGNLGVLGREMCFPDSIIGIEPNESYNQDYILLFLRSQQSHIRSISYQKSGQPNIKIPVIANLSFPLPPLT